MPRFDGFQRASFGAIAFPCEEIEVRGGIRDHVHEYPHNPGGTPEKMGRKLYEIDMVCPFHDTFAAYPTLYPDGLAALRGTYEAEMTLDLVVPTVGTIKAYCVDWKQRATGRARSGERVSFRFREDMPPDDIDAFVAKDVTTKGYVALAQKFKVAAQDGPQPGPSLFDDIQNGINGVLAVKDQANLYGNLVEAKLLALANVCSQIDQLDLLKDPTMFRIAAAMHDIWKATLDALKDLTQQQKQLSKFTTPTTMAIGDVARRLYGNAARAVELLQLNPITDAFAIPAGTTVRYYASDLADRTAA
jgi:hypothetical protein